jgi:hypothetical protein
MSLGLAEASFFLYKCEIFDPETGESHDHSKDDDQESRYI